MKRLVRTAEKGFTLIEMLVIAPIVILAIGAFLTVIISMTGEVIASRGSNELAYNIQDALNRIEQDVKMSNTALARNNITLTAGEAQGYNNDATNFTNVGGTSGTSLILSAPVTNGNPLTATSGIVYLTDKPNSCSSTSVRENTPMTMNIVYFVKDNTLWRRVIMPSNYATPGIGCSSPWQLPSCAPGYTASFCKTEDTKLVSGTSVSLFIQYFSDASGTVPNTTATNTGASVTARNSALFSSATVSVSIGVTQSIAGRDIERSATLRASRLDTNASTVGNAADDSAPGTPAPTGSYTFGSPTSVKFTWPAVTGGNITYTLDYNIDGGSWINGLTGSGSRSYTVNAGYNNATVNVRVRATNSTGNSSYGTTSYATPIWVPPTLENGWRNYDNSYNKPGFTKTSGGVVMLRGLIASGTASSGANIFRLPDGYRPQYQMTFETLTNANVFSRVIVSANGYVWVDKADTGYLTLDGIFFTPTTNLMGYTNATPFYNSWNNYTTVYGGDYGPVSYGLDSVGRVQTRGLACCGSFTAGLRIFELPGSFQPSPSSGVLITPSSSSVYADIQIDSRSGSQGPGIQIAHGGSSYAGIQTMYYPTSFSGWTTLSMASPANWVYYGAPFVAPRYTKASDGIVTLSGLIKSGSTTSGAIIATLPPGYRPTSGAAIFGVASGSVAIGRIDIDTDGNILYRAGGNTWLSLDGIHFIGE